MRESCTYGSVRGARDNSRPYRDCDSYLAAFGAKRTSASGCLTIAVYEYTHQVVLTKVVVFSTNDLVDDRLCVLIPMLCPTAVTNPEGDFGTTKDIGPLVSGIGGVLNSERRMLRRHAVRCTAVL